MVYDMTVLNEHPVLFIFVSGGNFWVGQEMGSVIQKFFGFLKSPFHGLSNDI